jgi:hypothetical protein
MGFPAYGTVLAGPWKDMIAGHSTWNDLDEWHLQAQEI